jgi:hypothetical protein
MITSELLKPAAACAMTLAGDLIFMKGGQLTEVEHPDGTFNYSASFGLKFSGTGGLAIRKLFSGGLVLHDFEQDEPPKFGIQAHAAFGVEDAVYVIVDSMPVDKTGWPCNFRARFSL